MSIEGRIYKDNAQPLLHRLPLGRDMTPCGIWEVALADQLFEDSPRFRAIAKCSECFYPGTMQERGEVWQYGIVSEYGPENDFDSFEGFGINALPPGRTVANKLNKSVKVVRRRVSEWEEFDR